MKKIKDINIVLVVILGAFILFACKKNTTFDYKDGTDEFGEPTVNISIDTNIKKVDVSKYPQARIFPGLVCKTEPRINAQVELSLNYNYVASDLRISLPPQPQYSTGLYAAPGELVIITVPEGIYSLIVQIGAWTDNLSNIENPPRDEVLVLRSGLAPGKNYFRNLYGGHIYISPQIPITTPVKLNFANVVKSPDFVLGETSNTDWINMVKNSCVPWLELRSKNIIFTIPTEYCKNANVTDPTALMKEWDEAIDIDYYQWEGLSAAPADSIDRAPLLPWRIVQDIKPVAGYAHSGFPVVAQNDLHWLNQFIHIDNIRGVGNSDSRSCWGAFHELGHNNQQTRYWSWSTLGEVTCNLFSFKVARRQELNGYTQAWPPAHPALPNKFPIAIEFAKENMVDKNFDGTDSRINDPFARLTPFIQLFEKVPANRDYNGYDIITELYKKSRRALGISTSNQLKRDFFYETVCDFTRLDWKIFFDKWGIRVSDIARDKMARLYEPLNQNIWEYNPLTRKGGDTKFEKDPYDPLNWKITGFSSEELEGEGGATANALIDRDENTFWHTEWYRKTAAPPHWIIIDLGTVLNLKGFNIKQRAGGATNVKTLKIEYSSDNNNYKIVTGSPFNLPQTNSKINLPISEVIAAKYIRLTVSSMSDVYANNTYVALAEFEIVRP